MLSPALGPSASWADRNLVAHIPVGVRSPVEARIPAEEGDMPAGLRTEPACLGFACQDSAYQGNGLLAQLVAENCHIRREVAPAEAAERLAGRIVVHKEGGAFEAPQNPGNKGDSQIVPGSLPEASHPAQQCNPAIRRQQASGQVSDFLAADLAWALLQKDFHHTPAGAGWDILACQD